MKVSYDLDLDLLEISLRKASTVGVSSDHDDILMFKDKKTGDIVGWEVENASRSLHLIISELSLSKREVLGVLLHINRKMAGKTQEEYAAMLNTSLSNYKRIENAEANFTFDTLEMINNKTGIDLALLFKKVG